MNQPSFAVIAIRNYLFGSIEIRLAARIAKQLLMNVVLYTITYILKNEQLSIIAIKQK